MKKRSFYSIFLVFVIGMISACSSKESEFNGRWRIYSAQFSYEEPVTKEANEYFIFKDGSYLRTFSDNYEDQWESEGQRYEVLEDKFIMYTKIGTMELNTTYAWEFVSDNRLKLTSDPMTDYDGSTYNYCYVLDRQGDE